MKRALLLLAVWTLGLAAPAFAAPWNARRPAPAAAFAGAAGRLELAQRDARPEPVRPDSRTDPRPDALPQSAPPKISPQQAEAAIARAAPGRRLDIRPGSRNGQPVWEVRWLTTDGRRIDFVVDGSTGQIVSRSGD